MNYLIGTDIGTSGTKTIIMNTEGKLISSDLQEYDILTPRPLWAEQWPDLWVDAVKRSIRNAKEKAKINPDDIKGISISGLYGGSGVPVDKNMKPVRPCLIWMDKRASKQEQWVLENIGKEEIYKITHNGTNPYYGYTKILWIKDNEPENWSKIKLFLPPNAYAIYHLTGEIAIDYSSAGNIGGIFDAKNRKWSDKMLSKMGIPRTMMPERIVESSDIVGHLTTEAASEMGLQKDIPLFAGGVDCVVATLGLGVFEPGSYAAAIGTSMCAALVHEEPISSQNLIEMPYVKDPKRLSYSFGGGTTAGAVVKWFRDNLAQLEKEAQEAGGPDAYEALNEQASEIAPGSNGLVVLPYFMGERSPLWNTDAKGVIFGLSLAHTKAHLYRAFLEAVAFSLRHAMECSGAEIDSILLAGGVTKSRLWRQIFANVTGKKIICPQNDVEANLGDVMLAGIGSGLLTFDEMKDWQTLDEPVLPDMEQYRLYDKYYQLYHSIYDHLKDDMKKISEIEKETHQ
jgi:xylulokinase